MGMRLVTQQVRREASGRAGRALCQGGLWSSLGGSQLVRSSPLILSQTNPLPQKNTTDPQSYLPTSHYPDPKARTAGPCVNKGRSTMGRDMDTRIHRPCLKKHRSSISATSPMSVIKSARNIGIQDGPLCGGSRAEVSMSLVACVLVAWWRGQELGEPDEDKERGVCMFILVGAYGKFMSVCLSSIN